MTIPTRVKDIAMYIPTLLVAPAIEQALDQIQATITQKDTGKGVWLAQTRIGMTTFGANIRVSAMSSSRGCQVRVECTPRVNTIITITDGGASTRLISQFEQALVLATLQISFEAERMNKIEKGLMCPTCGGELLVGMRFCPTDGTAIANLLVLRCVKCANNNPKGAKFCSHCGIKF